MAMHGIPGFPNWGQLVGGQFEQNGQKLHENDKIGIFWVKIVGGHGGGQANFSVSGGSPPSPPPLGETQNTVVMSGLVLLFATRIVR